MRRKLILLLTLLFFSSTILNFNLFSQSKKKTKTDKTKQKTTAEIKTAEQKLKITFIELGSVNCIPCKMMQPIMESIEKKYGDQIKVVFHDVWKDDAPAKQYGIRVIPTQVFLDENNKEFLRHEGYYPEKEIDNLLQSKGLKPNE
jgi:thioredoxin 1